jgi:hypothetical protein
MGLIQTIKSRQSFIKNEVPAMGPGEGAPEEALNGAQ